MCCVVSAIATAQQSALLEQHKNILAMTQSSWMHFRDYNGQQLIYFTHLEVYRCAIAKVRYSLNTTRLDQSWDLAPCDPDDPHAIDAENYPPYVTLPLGSASWAAIQLTFPDGTQSKVVRIEAN
jgi:hypothetical protein